MIYKTTNCCKLLSVCFYNENEKNQFMQMLSVKYTHAYFA